MRLVLLRHGRTKANEARLYCGSTDLPLSENGLAELKARKERTDYPPLEGLRVLTSGMRRTNETLEAIYGVAPQETVPGLAEMDFGRFEGFSYEQLKDDPEYLAWILDERGEVAPPGGESRAAFRARIGAALNGIRQDALIVTHGGVITEIMAMLFPEEGKGFYDWQPDCGRGYVIDTEAHTYRKIGDRDEQGT